VEKFQTEFFAFFAVKKVEFRITNYELTIKNYEWT